MNAAELEKDFPRESGMQKDIDVENYFAVRAKLWNPNEGDYSLAPENEDHFETYRDFLDALDRYDALQQSGVPGDPSVDIKLDLLHYRFGTEHLVKSTILFPKR